MGLFSRRMTVAVPKVGWQADGTGVVCNGEIDEFQWGESYSVRFENPSAPGYLITVTYYAAEREDHVGEFVVRREVQWLVCSDPSESRTTEIWSEYGYDTVSDPFASDEAAEEEAGECANVALGLAENFGTWTEAFAGYEA